jgi:transposase-like protein
MDRVSEIISRVERRRRWSAEEKVKVLTEALEPGATVSAVADRNGISRSQLYAWMKRARRGDIPGISLKGSQKPLFAPVRIAAVRTLPTPTVTARAAACPQRRPGVVEIALTNGRVVRAEEGIEPARLARLVAALDGARP